LIQHWTYSNQLIMHQTATVEEKNEYVLVAPFPVL